MSGKPDCVSEKGRDIEETGYQNEIAEIIAYLNEKTGKNFFSNSRASAELIIARLREGHTAADFRRAIDNKVSRWKGTDMERFLRPSTLFAPDKFDAYVNETPVSPECHPGDNRTVKRKHYYDGDEIQRQLLAQFMEDG